jgi:hypothetical protein
MADLIKIRRGSQASNFQLAEGELALLLDAVPKPQLIIGTSAGNVPLTGVWHVQHFTVDAAMLLTKKVVLSKTPIDPELAILAVRGGPSQFYADDYTVVGNEVRWNGLGLDGLLEVGDRLRVLYFS